MSEIERALINEMKEQMAGYVMTMFWILGVYILISSITTVWQLSETFAISNQQQKSITSDEAYRNFLDKRTYHRLQKDARNTYLECDKNPLGAPWTMEHLNKDEAEQLDLVYKTRGGSDKESTK